MRKTHLFASFVVGACAGTTASTVAESPPQEEVHEEAPPTPAFEIRKADAVQTRWLANGKAHIDLLAQGTEAFVGRLTMDGGAAVPEHQDATEEYIHVLEGGGVITIDGVDTDIGPGDTVFMPANATVKYANGDQPLVALQVFAGPEPAKKYDKWLADKPR